MKKTLSKEEALQYIIQNADKYNIPKAYIGADYLDNEKKYLYSIFFICGQIIEQQITFHNYKNNHCFKFANKVTPYYMKNMRIYKRVRLLARSYRIFLSNQIKLGYITGVYK